MKMYQRIARTLEWYRRVHELAVRNKFAEDLSSDSLDKIRKQLPSGSGIDSGTEIDMDASHGERIVLIFGFHHMDENGFYDGWTDHKAIITPSLADGYRLRITGRDKHQIKDYLYQVFDAFLNQEFSE